MNHTMAIRPPLSRRSLLRGLGGAALALPLLEAMQPARAAGAEAVPRRLVAMNFGLGLYADAFFPKQLGADYELSPYLERLKEHREEMTIISGLCHPGVNGGHRSEPCIFTGTPNDAGKAFKNGISLDELVAERLGDQTRFDALRVGHQRTNICWNRQGIPLPFEMGVQSLYETLFRDDKQTDRELMRRRLRSGQSVLDLVGDSARRLRGEVSRLDQAKLDEYFESVRSVEQRLQKDEAWLSRPKPQVEMKAPTSNLATDPIGKMRVFFDLMLLALKTDSTRCLVYAAPTTATIQMPGEQITTSYHNLTHHGHDPEKIRQMMLIDCAMFDEVNRLLSQLKETREEGERLLDRTTVLITSNLGNGAGHGCKNLPVMLAGGGLRHGQHLHFAPPNTTPMSNLYVSLLQNLGLEIDQFSLSTGTLNGIDQR